MRKLGYWNLCIVLAVALVGSLGRVGAQPIYMRPGASRTYNEAAANLCTSADPCDNQDYGSSPSIMLPDGVIVVQLSAVELLRSFNSTGSYEVHFLQSPSISTRTIIAEGYDVKIMGLRVGEQQIHVTATSFTLQNCTIDWQLNDLVLTSVKRFTIINSVIPTYNLDLASLEEIHFQDVNVTDALTFNMASITITKILFDSVRCLSPCPLSFKAANITMIQSHLKLSTTSPNNVFQYVQYFRMTRSSIISELGADSLIMLSNNNMAIPDLKLEGSSFTKVTFCDDTIAGCIDRYGLVANLFVTNSQFYQTTLYYEATVQAQISASRFEPLNDETLLILRSPLCILSGNQFELFTTNYPTVILHGIPSSIVTFNGDLLAPWFAYYAPAGSHTLNVDGSISTTRFEPATGSTGGMSVNIYGILAFDAPASFNLSTSQAVNVKAAGIVRVSRLNGVGSLDTSNSLPSLLSFESASHLQFEIPADQAVLGSSWIVATKADALSGYPSDFEATSSWGYYGIFDVVDAKLIFNVSSVSCSSCSGHGYCEAPNVCSCVDGWAGLQCGCETFGYSVNCSASDDRTWTTDSDFQVPTNQTIIVPPDYLFKVKGNLSVDDGGSIQIGGGSSVSANGTLSNSGDIYISANLSHITHPNGSCTLNPDASLIASQLMLPLSSRIHLLLDTSSNLMDSLPCLSIAPIQSTGASELSGTLNITIEGDANTKLNIKIITSGNSDSSSTSLLILTNTPPGTCSSVSSSPGAVSLFVQPCEGPNEPKSKSSLRWYYWGIPVIAVAAIGIVVASVILFVPKVRTSVLPYRQ